MSYSQSEVRFQQPPHWSRRATLRDPHAAHQLDICVRGTRPALVAVCNCGERLGVVLAAETAIRLYDAHLARVA